MVPWMDRDAVPTVEIAIAQSRPTGRELAGERKCLEAGVGPSPATIE
jgi:hypothetical protein